MNWILFAWKNVMRNKRRSLTAMLITAMGTAAVLIGGGFALFTYESLEEMTARDSGHVVLAAQRGFDNDEDVPLQHGFCGARGPLCGAARGARGSAAHPVLGPGFQWRQVGGIHRQRRRSGS
jgi:hypothetical protein